MGGDLSSLVVSIEAGAGSVRTVTIELPPEGVYSFGRGAGNSCELADDRISRQHARITRRGGGYFLKDVGSSRGTLFNEEPLREEKALRAGDAFQMGGVVVRVQQVRERAGDAPPPPLPPPPAPPPLPAPAREAAPAEDLALAAMYTDEMMALKRRIHEQILSRLKLSDMAAYQEVDDEMRNKVERVLDDIMREVRHEMPSHIGQTAFREAMLDELLEFGPISPLLRDPQINEIMVNGPHRIFIEKKVGGKGTQLLETGVRFFDDRHLLTIIHRIVEPLGRRVDESSPMVDARLPDGSRVNAIIPPLALDGSSLTIRKFSKEKLTTVDLTRFGSLTPAMALFLEEAVRSRQNILISGGTGSGKTTLLNIISQFIPLDERIVTIEDSAELKLSHRDLVRLEARPANIEGKGRIAIRDLVINSLRMRPDRIVVGECRGAEAFDMLQAMNTGHDGSLTTIHANTPRDSLLRLENMVLMAGFELPSVAIREQIASAVDLVVQQTRLVDGSRKVTQISEVTGREGNVVLMQDIFVYDQSGFEQGKVVGEFRATGNMPRFVELLRQKGDLRLDLSVFKKG